jgi:hypothetical protein
MQQRRRRASGGGGRFKHKQKQAKTTNAPALGHVRQQLVVELEQQQVLAQALGRVLQLPRPVGGQRDAHWF